MRFVILQTLWLILALATVAPAEIFVFGENGFVARGPATRPAATAPAPAANPASQPQADNDWLEDFKQAHARARESRRPILVRGGAPWCGWCRKLDVELQTPLVRAQLARWVLVYLDVDAQPEKARSLHIGPIPALRLLGPSGTVVAQQDGFMPAAELATWLQQNFEKAATALSQDLLAEGPVDEKAVTQLVARLDVQDSGMREAVIRRLVSHRQQAGRAVAAAFLDGRLATRLSALELLREWQAPIEGLDPWDPPTLTVPRLTALRAWSAELPPLPPATAPASAPQTLLDTEVDVQLTRLLTTTDPAERSAAIEQLARHGEPLLPRVYERLQTVQNPAERVTLTWLRYRLVASSSIVLAWPDGLERLGSPDTAVRQAAAQELAKRASAADARLLIELFSDSDPLVRELSLTALREVGGNEASEAITRLLEDPEANVRAAVLKVLAEKPNPAVVAIICGYADKEKDPDLVGHAARALRAARTPAAAEGLIKLLEHQSWRVRAEAAEGLAEVLQNQRNSQTLQADGYAALIRRLDDDDSFVASRAIEALKHSPLIATAVDPILRTLQRHPELAGSVVEMLGSNTALRLKALPQLRAFCQHEEVSVRAAAVKAVCEAAGPTAEAEVTAALADPAPEVRVAAAGAVFELIESLREDRNDSGSGNITVSRAIISTLFGRRSSAPTSQASPDSRPAEAASASWLQSFRRGAKGPAWLTRVAPSLEKMLAAPSTEEQFLAALDLIALGHAEPALSRLQQIIAREPDRLRLAGAVLPWVEPDKRTTLFRDWYPRTRSADELAALCEHLTAWSEPQMLPVLWEVLANDWLAPEAIEGVLDPMVQVYLGNHRWDPSGASVAQRVRMGSDAGQHLASQSEFQRLAALIVLAHASRDEAVEAARKIYQELPPGTPLRRDAFHILLLSEPRRQAEAEAAAAVRSGEAALRSVALRYLALGPAHMQQVRGHISVRFDPSAEFKEMYQTGARTFPAPAGLDPAVLEPLLEDADRDTVAAAAYLLALHQRQDAIPVLIRCWREAGARDDVYQQLVYRAIAASNDVSRITVLEEIYSRFDKGDYRLRDFYWSIRSMTGEQVLALRKKIRDEVGMQNLQ